MKITFKKIDDGLSCEIFVDDTYIGIVKSDIWTGQWNMRPDFNYFGPQELIKKVKYDSSYKAGKALVKFYKDMFKGYDESLDDTQELDMRDIWKSFKKHRFFGTLSELLINRFGIKADKKDINKDILINTAKDTNILKKYLKIYLNPILLQARKERINYSKYLKSYLKHIHKSKNTNKSQTIQKAY